MSKYVEINPELIRWAVDRSGLPLLEFRQPVTEWIQGKKLPTVKMLEAFCKKAMVPLAFLFLPAPPVETLPIPDFRTVASKKINAPSPNLLDTIDDMSRRQEWMREYLLEDGAEKLSFVGTASRSVAPRKIAGEIRRVLQIPDDWFLEATSIANALRTLRLAIDDAGIMVSMAGQVGLNTRRLLSADEFRGFVLVDEYAPLIFVNTNDSKTGQLFTIMHELVHVWIGKSGLFNLAGLMPQDHADEIYCNSVAAELLMPESAFKDAWDKRSTVRENLEELAVIFKASKLAVARRAVDFAFIPIEQFFVYYEKQQQEWKEAKANRDRSKPAPVFWQMQDARIGSRFGRAVSDAVSEGRLPYTEAFDLTGLKADTFNRFSRRILARQSGAQS